MSCGQAADPLNGRNERLGTGYDFLIRLSIAVACRWLLCGTAAAQSAGVLAAAPVRLRGRVRRSDQAADPRPSGARVGARAQRAPPRPSASVLRIEISENGNAAAGGVRT
jgi:hypothetical protein